MSCSPSSKPAASPSLRLASSISAVTFSTTSSMRAGWMRPSATSCSIACLATVRRYGSKLDRMMAPGVSSTISSTPVAFSSARMLRPSRPMMRPLRSSLGRSTTETVASRACSGALRWIACVTIWRAFSAACSRASCSRRFTRFAASRRASDSICLISASFASSAVMPDTRCSSRSRSLRELLVAFRARRGRRLALAQLLLAAPELLVLPGGVRGPVRRRPLLRFQLALARGQRLLALGRPFPRVARFLLGGLPQRVRFLLGREQQLLLARLGVAQHAFGFLAGAAEDLPRRTAPHGEPDDEQDDGGEENDEGG